MANKVKIPSVALQLAYVQRKRQENIQGKSDQPQSVSLSNMK
jgi:hypothetical protein